MNIRFGRLGFWLALLFVMQSGALAETQIKPFVRGSYQQIVAAHSGKPFIVGMWSVNCTYCGAELAMLKKLVAKYPKLDLVLISTDTPQEEKVITATLAKYSLHKAEAWVFADSYAERLRFEIDKEWYGELPRTYLFAADRSSKGVSGNLEQYELESWVRQQYGPR